MNKLMCDVGPSTMGHSADGFIESKVTDSIEPSCKTCAYMAGYKFVKFEDGIGKWTLQTVHTS